MAQKFQILDAGKTKLKEATVTSTGAAQAGDVVGLDSSGKLDPSVLPIGVGPDVKILEATEDIGAGDYVNIWNDGGTAKVRLADNSNLREAHGWVKEAFLTGASATIYFEGPNDAAAVNLPGQRAYLGTAGGILVVPLNSATESNKIHQLLGTYVDTSIINTDIDDCIVL